MVLAANALKDEELRPGWHWKWLLVAAGAGLAVLLHAYWEWKYVSRSAMRDRDDAVTIDNTLRELVNVAPVGRSGEYRSLVAHGWQVGVTLLLALVLIVVVTD